MIPLFHRTYAIPMIACLYLEQGAKFVTLVNRLAAGRDTISMTLKYLMDRDLVQRNPGYGHPLRPEYILSSHGATLGPVCVELRDSIETLGIDDIAFRKWPLPVLTAVGSGAERFSEVMQCLRGITPRALTTALRDLGGRHLVERRVIGGWPPHPTYHVGELGEAILPELDRLRVVARTAF